MGESDLTGTAINPIPPYELEMEFGGEPLRLSTGKLAKQANASVIAQVGGTVSLVSVVMAPPADVPKDFFPLTVDYREKMYAAGRMPGGYFKRESRPGDNETLRARLVDRPLRPLFPDGFRQEIQVYINVLSFDGKNSADVASLTAASAALYISDIPFNTPCAGVRVGYNGTDFILNPTLQQQAESKLDLVVAGTAEAIMMVEAGANFLTEEEMLRALEFAHGAIKGLCAKQVEMREKIGRAKASFTPVAPDADLVAKIKAIVAPKLGAIHDIAEKQARAAALDAIKQEVVEALAADHPDVEKVMRGVIEDVYADSMRQRVLTTGVRADGRKLDEIRPISIETSVLPCTHGSAVFTRGQTQSLGVLTLGTSDDVQEVDDLEEVTAKRFYLHYNFPSFSVGEVRPVRGPGRREIGHGHLAERSVAPIIPPQEEFPYVIRLVSEILESNGSSSMASVCSATLALMDGGVPIKSPVAGIAMGLILEDGKFAVLSDIMGLEDHLGDMDFKVAGNNEGITALQMDIKIQGVTLEIMAKALEQAKAGRRHILGKMLEAIPATRTDLKETAPRITSFMIDPEKIREVIGSGGKVIREITAKTGTKIDIEDSGKISVASNDGASMERAIKWIKDIVSDAELNAVYNGKVVRIVEFGAFIEILPGKDGLLHVSEIENYRVNRVEDVLKLGDEVQVKVIGIEPNGKVRLSRRAVLYGDSAEGGRKEGGDRGDRGGRGDRGDRGKGGRGERDRGDRGGERGPRTEGGAPAPSGERRAPSARVEAVLTRAADRLKAATSQTAAEVGESTPAAGLGHESASADAGFDPFARRFDDSIERPDND